MTWRRNFTLVQQFVRLQTLHRLLLNDNVYGNVVNKLSCGSSLSFSYDLYNIYMHSDSNLLKGICFSILFLTWLLVMLLLYLLIICLQMQNGELTSDWNFIKLPDDYLNETKHTEHNETERNNTEQAKRSNMELYLITIKSKEMTVTKQKLVEMIFCKTPHVVYKSFFSFNAYY